MKDVGLFWKSHALVKSLTLLWSLPKVESCSRALPHSSRAGSAVSFYNKFLLAVQVTASWVFPNLSGSSVSLDPSRLLLLILRDSSNLSVSIRCIFYSVMSAVYLLVSTFSFIPEIIWVKRSENMLHSIAPSTLL